MVLHHRLSRLACRHVYTPCASSITHQARELLISRDTYALYIEEGLLPKSSEPASHGKDGWPTLCNSNGWGLDDGRTGRLRLASVTTRSASGRSSSSGAPRGRRVRRSGSCSTASRRHRRSCEGMFSDYSRVSTLPTQRICPRQAHRSGIRHRDPTHPPRRMDGPPAVAAELRRHVLRLFPREHIVHAEYMPAPGTSVRYPSS